MMLIYSTYVKGEKLSNLAVLEITEILDKTD